MQQKSTETFDVRGIPVLRPMRTSHVYVAWVVKVLRSHWLTGS